LSGDVFVFSINLREWVSMRVVGRACTRFTAKPPKLLISLALGGALCIVAPARAAINLGNIMPLGDSITEGVGAVDGYRLPLYNLLHNNGYTFTFVGDQNSNSDASLTSIGQGQHEGNSGFVIQNLGASPGDPSKFFPAFTPVGAVYDELGSVMGPGKMAPDYILLLIGTNDIANDYNDDPNAPQSANSAHAPGRLDQVISAIANKTTGLRPNAHLIVAEIPPTAQPVKNAPFQTFDAAIPQIIANHQALGENVTMVDLYTPLDPATDFADGFEHPNGSGYQKIATAWYNGIAAIGAVPNPEPSTLSLLGIPLLMLRRRHRQQPS
jgi:lysophospholipase L1-like esterase